MKKSRLIVVLMLFVLLLTSQTFAASKAKEEKAIKKTVTTFLKNAKKYNVDNMTKTLLPRSKRNGFRYFKESSEIARAIKRIQKETFDYEIKKIKVTGKTAKAIVNVTYFDGKQGYISAMIDTGNYLAYNGISYSDDVFFSKFYENMISEYKKNSWIYTETVKSTIPLRKYKGKWKISKITKLMEKYVNCNFYEGLNAVDKLYD